MNGWEWLRNGIYSRRLILRVLLKAALLFVLANIIFAVWNPSLAGLTLYNWLVPGRERLPYGEHPQAFNLSINDIDTMLKSHEIARPKGANEYRVIVIGDSSVWGVLLKPDETLTAYLNEMDLTADDGREMVFYNLGYPTMSILKDTLILDAAQAYQPDALIWLTTLQSFWQGDQTDNPIVRNNNGEADGDVWSRTLVGRRRELADWLRLQLYGFSWMTTGIDQFYPDPYMPLQTDYDEDLFTWKTFTEPTNLEGELVFTLIKESLNGFEIPVLLVNEPMYISSGRGSEERYNFFYPKWAYDQYREQYAAFTAENNIPFLDLWDAIDPSEFTDTAVHLTPAGSKQLAELIADALP